MRETNIGLYPGSFNPWHGGHSDILLKALSVFDRVIVVKAINPEKKKEEQSSYNFMDCSCVITPLMVDRKISLNRVWFTEDDRPLEHMVNQGFEDFPHKIDAIIRGLRNGNDLQYEMNQQYWNEDVGIKIPFIYFITDRKLGHVSSSSIRAVEKMGLKHNY